MFARKELPILPKGYSRGIFAVFGINEQDRPEVAISNKLPEYARVTPLYDSANIDGNGACRS